MFSFLFLLGHLSVERLSVYSQFPIPAFNNSPLSADHRRRQNDVRGVKWKQTLTTQEIQSRLRIGLVQNVGGVEKSGNKYAFFFAIPTYVLSTF